jgi:hypothetical protein
MDSLEKVKKAAAELRQETLKLEGGMLQQELSALLIMVTDRLTEAIKAVNGSGHVGYTNHELLKAEDDLYDTVMGNLCTLLKVDAYSPYEGDGGPDEGSYSDLVSILQAAGIMDDNHKFATLTVEDKLEANEEGA